MSDQQPKGATNAFTILLDVADELAADPGPVENYARVKAERDALKAELLNQRVLGHGDGQQHAIDDVNAGRVDDLIRPRLDKAESAHRSLCTALRELEQHVADLVEPESGAVALAQRVVLVDQLTALLDAQEPR